MQHSIHDEIHLSNRNHWLRAAVLGANDGLISTASLLVGVAAASTSSQTLLLTGMAALTAGALSMAAGEYISVSSQADTEKADLDKERHELTHNSERELIELTKIYETRGLDHVLAHQVAVALTEHDALEAHARDEIGLTDLSQAKPIHASVASGLSFIAGAILPIIGILLLPAQTLVWSLATLTIVGLALLGIISARLGGAPVIPATARVVIWGVLAMVATSLIGRLFGVAV
ncbi:VIT family protein [Psychrobacter sp. ANT_WB68]|uniref:VIT1/CCC1 transporter family protein n=1 Tax=Psychrobacter sp. ANT_WB68 TaxID=2597355 RepID=UPI0011F2A64F|nr:VIT family protein [Psychrobacter sp. ANT_WB68]KAA0914517.1 VIT family protein [Psychrobacter sp. ANT_WB68]